MSYNRVHVRVKYILLVAHSAIEMIQFSRSTRHLFSLQLRMFLCRVIRRRLLLEFVRQRHRKSREDSTDVMRIVTGEGGTEKLCSQNGRINYCWNIAKCASKNGKMSLIAYVVHIILWGFLFLCDSCCDIGQIDRFSIIELFPLSSCQVIILIARMTFNCFSSCLMS